MVRFAGSGSTQIAVSFGKALRLRVCTFGRVSSRSWIYIHFNLLECVRNLATECSHEGGENPWTDERGELDSL